MTSAGAANTVYTSNTSLLNQTIQQLSYIQPFSNSDAPCTNIDLYNSEGARSVQCNKTTLSSSQLVDTVFTIPGRAAANVLSQVFQETVLDVRTKFVQPAVETSCYFSYIQTPQTINTTWLENTYIPMGPLVSGVHQTFNFSSAPSLNLTSCQGCPISVLWAPAPQSASYSFLLGQIEWDDEYINTVACGLSAFWMNATVHLSSKTGVISAEGISPALLKKVPQEPIQMSLEWATALFQLYLSRLPRSPIYFLQDSISLLLSFGLSSLGPVASGPGLASITAPYSEWAEENITSIYSFLNNDQIQALNRSINSGDLSEEDFIMANSNWTEVNNLFRQHVYLTQHGYGFNLAGTTVKLALAVLILYQVIVVMFFTWTFKVGLASLSWDSVGDLLMLALNSKTPNFLGHTSAGIESLQTYGQDVRVMASTSGNEVELLFDNDPQIDWDLYERVEVNVAY